MSRLRLLLLRALGCPHHPDCLALVQEIAARKTVDEIMEASNYTVTMTGSAWKDAWIEQARRILAARRPSRPTELP